MTPEELAEVVKIAVRAVNEERDSSFSVAKRQHFKDHEQMALWQESKPQWEANHSFVSGIRASGNRAKVMAESLTIKGIFWILAGVVIYAATHFFTKGN